MSRKPFLLAVVLCLACVSASSQTAPPSPSGSSATAVWSALSAPAMDPAKSAEVKDLEITRDRIRIRLVSGIIQFAQPVNGVTFGAVFHGEGRLFVKPPNPMEAQQLQLFTRQDKLGVTFSDATFSFTDGLADDIAKHAQWRASGPATDELYASRQKAREDLGAAYLPRLFRAVLSGDAKRTAFFLADLKTKDGWIEALLDATQPEAINVGRWRDVGPFKLRDVWMSFPSGNRDPKHAFDDPMVHADYVIPHYDIRAAVAENADLTATTQLTLQPRYAGERVLLFTLDSNLRLASVKDSQNHALDFFQSRETKDRF